MVKLLLFWFWIRGEGKTVQGLSRAFTLTPSILFKLVLMLLLLSL